MLSIIQQESPRSNSRVDDDKEEKEIDSEINEKKDEEASGPDYEEQIECDGKDPDPDFFFGKDLLNPLALNDNQAATTALVTPVRLLKSNPKFSADEQMLDDEHVHQHKYMNDIAA